MANIFKYYTVPTSHMASAKQVVLSIMRGNFESGQIDRPNFIIEDSSHNIEYIQNSIDIAKGVKENERLLQKRMDDAIENLKVEMLTRTEDNRQDKLNEKMDRAIENLRREIEILQTQFEIEVLARKEKEDRVDKLNSKIDKFVQFFKRETRETHARFALEELARREHKDEITRLKGAVENIYQSLEQIQGHMKDADMELADRITGLEDDLKMEKEDIMLYIEEQRREDLIDIFNGCLWKRVTVRINGFELEGVLIQVSCDYLVVISSSDIFVVPVKRIDFVSFRAV